MDTPETRTEIDSMGEIEVPVHRYWGAQTQRSLRYFSIGEDRIPLEVIHALALVKKAAALSNHASGRLGDEELTLISTVAEEILAGRLDEHFPLRVWMTGSGTQANMNVNEVIANRASELAGVELGSKRPVHPNDHVNMSQSTNDVFPAAMHVAAALAMRDRLLPSLQALRDALHRKAGDWQEIVKVGRTHLQDAVPLTLGQELSGYVGMLDDNLERIEAAVSGLYPLALGGTAVGTGLNTRPGFAEEAIRQVADLTGLPFVPARNRFAAMGSHDALVQASATLKTLAASLYKIANDIRLLSCGPRAGLNELLLPANEPGSSAMPGKVNPTQCEALTMIAVQVMGYDAAVALAGAGGHLEMNAYKPVMIFNVIQSIRILADGSSSFCSHSVEGMRPNRAQIDKYLETSLMLVTALVPIVGYDQAARIAHHAHEHDLTLKEAALELTELTPEDLDVALDPKRMV